MAAQRVRAFTIVELLVVLGIIALLAALVIPALTRAAKTARIAACLNNMRQVGLETIVWGQENPLSSPAGEVSPVLPRAQDAAGRTWVDLLGSDLPPEVFYCPEQAD
ncbi:MAG: type II secretion system protein, partial [Planctomycetota bacterium]